MSDSSFRRRFQRLPEGTRESVLRIVDQVADGLKTRRRLTMEEFSRTLKIAEGREKGRRFNVKHQPFQRLWFEEFDIGRTGGKHSPRWTRFATCGCVQSGKSLLCFDIPILYYALECGERVIIGVPTGDQASQKWEYELKPMIENSRYRWMLPKRGKGSRGGTDVTRIRLGNGAELIFMTGHGGDEKRSSTTSRIVIVTEADKMDESKDASKETDPVSQLIARTKSFREEDKVIVLECTVSNTKGRIWKEYTQGSQGTLYAQCPLCSKWVSPGREQLVDWRGYDNEIDAGENARWVCPECEGDITAHRDSMIDGCRLAHRGQTIDDLGNVIGDLPKTRTFGFRWSAFFNKFWTTQDIAYEEHQADRSENLLESIRNILQFTWAVPEDPPELDVIPLDAHTLRNKMSGPVYGKGIVPPDTKWITMGIDVEKKELWYIVLAFPKQGGTIHVVEYGRHYTNRKIQGDKATPLALTELYNRAEKGWTTPDGTAIRPSMVFCDSRFDTPFVNEWFRALPYEPIKRYYPSQGVGKTTFSQRKYTEKQKLGGMIHRRGDRYHKVWKPLDQLHIMEIDVDYWKTRTHERLGLDAEIPGAIRFYYSNKQDEHATLVSHFLAEKQTEEFIPGKGTEQKWVEVSPRNHLLDAIVYAQVAGHACGYRSIRVKKSTPHSPELGIAPIEPGGSGGVPPTPPALCEANEERTSPPPPRRERFLAFADGRPFRLKGD